MTSKPTAISRSSSQAAISSCLRFVARGVVIGMCLGLLAGCAGTPKPAKVDAQVTASSDVNPDLQGRPSPVILHIFELNSQEQFNRLDYMSLTQPSGAALGPDLLSKTQLILSPGDSQQLPLELNAQTTFIGLVAGFRNIDNAVWRTTVPVVQGSTKGVNVALTKQSITTTVN